jgi:hypothetical protein
MMTFAHTAAQYTRAPRILHSPVGHVSLNLLFSSCAHLRQKSISLSNMSYFYFTNASVIIQLQLAFCFFHLPLHNTPFPIVGFHYWHSYCARYFQNIINVFSISMVFSNRALATRVVVLKKYGYHRFKSSARAVLYQRNGRK